MSMRPVAAVFAVAMIALVCSTLAKAEDCGKRQTVAQAQEEVFKVSEVATIIRLRDEPRKAFLDYLSGLGVPDAPENDEVWIAKWNDKENSASVLVFLGA